MERERVPTTTYFNSFSKSSTWGLRTNITARKILHKTVHFHVWGKKKIRLRGFMLSSHKDHFSLLVHFLGGKFLPQIVSCFNSVGSCTHCSSLAFLKCEFKFTSRNISSVDSGSQRSCMRICPGRYPSRAGHTDFSVRTSVLSWTKCKCLL